MSLNASGAPANIILKFFLTSFLFLIIGIVMIGWLYTIIFIINFILGLRKSLSLWVPTCAQNFTDLCSFANISLFIFDGFQHGILFLVKCNIFYFHKGYYIHGIASGGASEGSIDFLKAGLETESKGIGRSRGMISTDPSGLQTYEILIPLDMRMKYNGIFKYHVEREVADKNRIQQLSQQSM